MKPKKPNMNSLFSLIRGYLKTHLPKQRNLSEHKIESYREVLNQLVDFLQRQERASLQNVTFEMLTTEL